jgi:hypothetical protein
VRPYESISLPGQRRTTSAFSAAANGALVQRFSRKEERS